MSAFSKDVQWELGFERAVEPEMAGDQFGLENRDDLDAINKYITGLPHKADGLQIAGKLTGSKYKEWQKLYDDWRQWYQKTIASWYVSDEDIAYARKKRDDINMVLIPEATKQVQKYAHDKKIAAKPEDFRSIEDQDKTFLQKHWLGISILGAAGVTAAYLSGNLLAFLKIAGKSSLTKQTAKLIHH